MKLILYFAAIFGIVRSAQLQQKILTIASNAQTEKNSFLSDKNSLKKMKDNIMEQSQKQLNQGKKQEIQAQNGFGKLFKRQINDGEVHYYQEIIPSQKISKIFVNNPNVLLYVSNSKRCSKPNEQCYEKIGNNYHPIIYEAQQQTTLMIAVKGLSQSQYTLTIMNDDSKYIQLQDSFPLNYRMDDRQDEVVFQFVVPSKQNDVSFKLISPQHSTIMIVSNNEEGPTGEQENQKATVNGQILFQKKDIKEKIFTIAIIKYDQFLGDNVPITIIASTKSLSQSQYETKLSGLPKQFAVNLEKEQQTYFEDSNPQPDVNIMKEA